ncbi:MAG TPA: hypothetical protein VHW23_15005 [Kofleriaceae bacterium]|jgi:hypothetical protein|nr:hypothetical protein [Kofleriaceae bacterium]
MPKASHRAQDKQRHTRCWIDAPIRASRECRRMRWSPRRASCGAVRCAGSGAVTNVRRASAVNRLAARTIRREHAFHAGGFAYTSGVLSPVASRGMMCIPIICIRNRKYAIAGNPRLPGRGCAP